MPRTNKIAKIEPMPEPQTCASEVKIRLTGLPEDVEKIAAALRSVALEESRDYANRNSKFVRRYLTVKL